MTRDDIIQIAHDVGLHIATDVNWMPIIGLKYLEKFAALVAAAEREACAKVCRSEADRALWNFQNDLPQNESFWNGAEQMASSCENAIRERGQHD